MRPAPSSRHLLAALILVGASAFSAYLAMHDDRISDAQVYAACAAMKRHQPELFPADPVFGPSDMWLLETPTFRVPLELILLPTSYQNLVLPFQAMTGVLTLLYLAGMYALLYHQCRSWSISVLVALLSATVISTLGDAQWGCGALASTTPEGFCLAVSPLLVLALLRSADRLRVLLVFGAVGLLGNIHLVTAMNLTAVLLLVYLGIHRFSIRYGARAAGCLFSAALGALPYTLYYLSLRGPASGLGEGTTYQAVRLAFAAADESVWLPQILTGTLQWEFLVRLVLLAVAATAVLLRVERYRVRHARAWFWFLPAALFVALALHGASQLIGALLGDAPPVLGFYRAAVLLLLPLYALLAQGLTNLFRLVRDHRHYLRWGCAVLLVAWMVPSDNLRVARHAAYEAATAFVDEANKPMTVLRHRAQRQRHKELRRIARYARDNTAPNAVFLTDELPFRMLARRSVVACRPDVVFFFYMRPGQLEAWTARVLRRSQASSANAGRADAEALRAFRDSLAGVEPFNRAGDWYVVLPKVAAPSLPGPLEIIASEEWGQYYVLCRIR